MNEAFLEILKCPECQDALAIAESERRAGDALVDGMLVCSGCGARFPVRGRIPRFVPDSGYVENFGWQWNRFAHLQRDSYNGTRLVRDTILGRSQWTIEFLAGRSLLECGCGSGNDTEVLAELCGRVVALDLSTSVDAIAPQVLERENVLVLQADLRCPPLGPATFDLCYCHRVIQHTPDPRAAFALMAPFVAPGGWFFLHSYDRHWKSMRHFKYWVRPLIRSWPHARVFRWLSRAGPVLYPLVGLLNRVAFLRRPVKYLIPFENHDRILRKAQSTLTRRERYEYALLITFDDLTPAHDHPNTPEALVEWFLEQGFIDIEIRSRRPSVVVGRKPREGELIPEARTARVGLPPRRALR
jgi:SAM-dependent methyltransferase